MTFAISIGKYGGFYWRHDYTTRLCLGWVAFTFYPFDIDTLHNKQVDRVTKLMECYHEAASDAARFHEALDGLYGAVLNDMTARDLPHEWAPDSAMGRAAAALSRAARAQEG